MSKKNRIRLFTDIPLQTGGKIVCPERSRHYLLNVMRCVPGDDVYVFNGQDGEYAATIETAGKKECVLRVGELFCPFRKGPDIWVLFAPLKKDNTDLVITKCVELGASELMPVRTELTSNQTPRADRLALLACEAAEQCRRQDVPVIRNEISLKKLLESWPEGRRLLYLDESGDSKTAAEVMSRCVEPAALLIGPEGGFSKKELEILRDLPYTAGITLGSRILRAETAAIAALACWQAFCGDWKKKGEENADSDC